MEPRRFRRVFFNPFTEKKRVGEYLPIFRGFFRTMPLHRWSSNDIQKMLGYAAVNPTLFGFPQQPTCIVNTVYFLPSYRSRVRGVFAFGTERGCKSILVPSSCSDESFDEMDAKLIEPLFRLNPGVEYVYLSRSCEGMAPKLTGYLAHCPRLREITLEGWTDAVAIHKIMMACKSADVLDTYSLDDSARSWKNELSVQALSTLIEMHPKLRAVKSHRLYLADWLAATQFSRCRHNVALVTFVCDYVVLLYTTFVILLCFPAYLVYRFLKWGLAGWLSPEYTFFWSVMGFVFTVLTGTAVDYLMCSRYGRAWVHMYKYPILIKRRVDLWALARQRGGGKSLVTVTSSSPGKGKAAASTMTKRK